MKVSSLAPLWMTALWVLPGPLSAQDSRFYLRTDLLFTSKYVWRGITRSQCPTLQGHGALALRLGRLRITGGGFASYEPFHADANHRTLAGVDQEGIGEADYWGEVSAALGEVELASGFLSYTFHGDAALRGLSSTANTTELFVRVDARGLRFSPSAAVWVDVRDVRGTYLELRASAPVLGWPYQPPFFITVDAELGVSLGQQPDPGGRQRANFAGDGPTHAQLGASALVSALPWLDFSAGTRLQFGFDDSTRVGADGVSRRLKWWVTAGAVIRPIPRRRPR